MRRGGARFHKQISPPREAADLGKKRGNEIRKRFLSEKISRRRNRRNQFRYYTLTLLAFCLTMTTYLCTIPFATSFLATFKSKFASPLEEPSNFTFPTECGIDAKFRRGRSSRRRRRGGCGFVVQRLASERRAQALHVCSGCSERHFCVCMYLLLLLFPYYKK